MAILREKDTLEALYRDLLSRHDYITSAGMFPDGRTGRDGGAGEHKKGRTP